VGRIAMILRQHWAIGIVIVAALLMRAHNLTQETLWMDEFFSIKAAVAFGEIIRSGEYIRQVGVVPVFYFLLLRGWISLFGSGLFAMRFLSVLFGAAGIYALYMLGAKLRNRTTGLIAAFLLSIHAGHFFHSQDVRHYTLFLFLTVLLFFLFDRYMATRRPRILGALLLTELFLAHTHFFGIFTILVIHVLHAVDTKANDGKQWNRYHGWGLGALGLSFIVYAGLSEDNLSNRISAIGPKTLLAQFREIAQWFAYGGDEFAERDIRIPLMSSRFAAPLMIVTMILGAWQWYRTDHRKCLTVLLWLTLPLAALFFISKLYRPVLLQRHIFNLTPAYLLLVAAGIDGLWCKRKLLGVLALCGVMATMLPALWAQTNQIKRFPLHEAAASVQEMYKKGDIIIVEPSYCRHHFAYYLNPSFGLQFRSALTDTAIQTPYVASYTGEGDERFWFYSSVKMFGGCEDATVLEPEKPVYIITRAERLLPVFVYYPYSLYPDRIIIVTNQWASKKERAFRLLESRVLRPFYRVTYTRDWNNNDITVTVFERTDARLPERL